MWWPTVTNRLNCLVYQVLFLSACLRLVISGFISLWLPVLLVRRQPALSFSGGAGNVNIMHYTSLWKWPGTGSKTSVPDAYQPWWLVTGEAHRSMRIRVTADFNVLYSATVRNNCPHRLRSSSILCILTSYNNKRISGRASCCILWMEIILGLKCSIILFVYILMLIYSKNGNIFRRYYYFI